MIETPGNEPSDSVGLKNADFVKALKDKYNEIREITIPNWHKLSLCSNEKRYIKTADVYLDWKLCWTISLVAGQSAIYDIDQIKIIWDEIYFRNGSSLQKIKDGKIYTLEDTVVFNYNWQAVLVEWDKRELLHHVKLWDNEIWGWYNMIEDTNWNELSLSWSRFDFNMSYWRLPMFGFIWKKDEDSGRVFVKIDPKTNKVIISEEFDKIEFSHGWNYPTMRWSNSVHNEEFPGCSRYK